MKHFILGIPGEESGMSKDEITLSIKVYIETLDIMTKNLDFKIRQANLQVYNKILKAREYYKLFREESPRFGEKVVIAFYNKAIYLAKYVQNTKEYKDAYNELYNQYLKHMELGSAFSSDFANYYIIEAEYTDLKVSIQKVQQSIIDLKVESCENIKDILDSHKWKDSTKENEYKDTKYEGVDLRKLAFEQLGEYIIPNIESLSIDKVVYWYLYRVASK